MLRPLILIVPILLCFGCAKPPEAELHAAQAALTRAYAGGAAELAPDEYQAAQATLHSAEDLIQQGRYLPALDLLPFATEQAELASSKALVERTRREQQRQAELEAEAARRRQEIPAAPKPRPVKPKPIPKPSPPTLLERYTVAADENLREISARPEIYNDPLLWPLLYKANRDQIKDPRNLHEGQELIIPRDSSGADLATARQEARESQLFPPPPDPDRGSHSAE